MTTTTTKEQQRATCPACFAVQAVNKQGRMSQHGYKRPQQWHSNVGTCSGAGVQHFGTEKGRDFTSDVARRLRNGADANEQTAQQVLDGTAPVYGRKRVAAGVYQEVVKENPSAMDRDWYANSLQQSARLMRQQALELDALVAAWVPVAPVRVAVEAKQPLRHLRGGYYSKWGKACAASAMAAQQNAWTVENVDEVTCEKCKKEIARRAERAAAAAK